MNKRKFLDILLELPATGRIAISLIVAGITFFLTQKGADPVKFVSVWLAFALSDLLMFWTVIKSAKANDIQRIAKNEDSSRTIIFLVVITACFVSLIAIILLLRSLPSARSPIYYTQVALTVATVISSWFLIHSVFTFHYAHLFYSDPPEGLEENNLNHGGLEFPGQPTPDYMDFAYFSFVVGMTFQVSDVQITSRAFRKLVLIHGLLSFAFNTVIVVLSINIIFGIIQPATH